MFISPDEITQTVRMIQEEHLDIRTVTLGINLLDCVTEDIKRTSEKYMTKYAEQDPDLCLSAEV